MSAATSAARQAGGSRAETRAAWFLLAPALAAIAAFFGLPLIAGFLLSFTDFDLYAIANPATARWVGLANYRDLLHDPLFWKALGNTVFLGFVGGPLTVALALGGAVLVNSRVARLKGFFRTVFFAPVVTTLVAVAVVWRYLYHPRFGLLNGALGLLGIFDPPIDWLGDPRFALLAITLLAVWRSFGYGLVLFVTGLQTIPESLYEAARLEGASGWQQFRTITLPLLRPTMLFVAVLTTVGLFQTFAEPYVMTRGGPLNATLTVPMLMYQQGFRWWSLGQASAIAFLLFGVILLGSALQAWLRRRGDR